MRSLRKGKKRILAIGANSKTACRKWE